MAKKKTLDETLLFFEYGLDIVSRTIYVGSCEGDEEGESGVDTKLAEQVIKALHILDTTATEGDKPINLIISGYGGDTNYALAIYDAIKLCKNEVIATCYGTVMSSHSIIFQAADRRRMTKNATQMIHLGSFTLSEHAKAIKNWALENERQNTLIEDIYLEKIQDKTPGFKRKDLQKMLNFDTILTSEQAIELGLADEVLQ